MSFLSSSLCCDVFLCQVNKVKRLSKCMANDEAYDFVVNSGSIDHFPKQVKSYFMAKSTRVIL